MSKDIGKSLLANIDTIIESWIEAIREDLDIESSKGLTYKSVRDSIPLVVKALASQLSESMKDRWQKAENQSWEHGIARATQGYDLAEVVREYGLLRKIIFTTLEPDLLSGSKKEILQVVELIDSIIDRVITLSLQSYVEVQLKELQQVRSQLILTNQELTRLVATQKEEVSHMAHELKSPLNAIMGFSSLLLKQQQKAAKGNETSVNLQMTERVVSNGKQLLRLINDILEISRYEAGKIPLCIEPSDIRSLVELSVETLSVSAEQKDLTIAIDCDRAPQEVQTDPLRIQQIIINLLSNAIRYTESGTITVTCSTNQGDRWSLIVADTGIGLSAEAQNLIFAPYYRVGSESDFSPDSTGLGLAIVDKLVKLLEGEISLVSELGEGSTFTVDFPLYVAENREPA